MVIGKRITDQKVGESRDLTQTKDGGILKLILKEGSDVYHPTKDDTILMHFEIILQRNGETVYSSRDESKPFRLDREYRKVEYEEKLSIKALDIGLATMRTGEVSRFTVEPKYGWANKGSQRFKVPKNAALLIEVELIDWEFGEEMTWDCDKSIRRSKQKEGNAMARSPSEGSTIVVQAKGWYLDSKDQNFREGHLFMDEQLEYVLGEAPEFDLPEGLDLSLRRFRVGERALIIIYRKWNYKSEGCAKYGVPPDAPLVYDLTMKKMLKHSKEAHSRTKQDKIDQAERLRQQGLKFYETPIHGAVVRQTASAIQEGKLRLSLIKFEGMIDLLGNMVGGMGKVKGSTSKKKPGEAGRDQPTYAPKFDRMYRESMTRGGPPPPGSEDVDPQRAEALMRGDAGDTTGVATAPETDWGELLDKRNDVFVAGLLNMAAVFLKMHDGLMCIKHCNTALETRPNCPKAIYRRAQAYEMQHNFARAITDYEAVLELEADNAAAMRQIVVCKAKRLADGKTDKKTYGGIFDKMTETDEKIASAKAEADEEERARQEVPQIKRIMDRAKQQQKEQKTRTGDLMVE